MFHVKLSIKLIRELKNMTQNQAMQYALDYNNAYGLDNETGAKVIAFMKKGSKYSNAIGTFRVLYPSFAKEVKHDKVYQANKI